MVSAFFRFFFTSDSLLGAIEAGHTSGALDVPPFTPITDPSFVIFDNSQPSFAVDNTAICNFIFLLEDIDNESIFGGPFISPDVIGEYSGTLFEECGVTPDIITVTSENGLFTVELEVNY